MTAPRKAHGFRGADKTLKFYATRNNPLDYMPL